MSDYYIGSDGSFYSEEDYIQHFGSGKGHKYLLKIGEGAKARYLYTQEEVAAYYNRGKNKGKNLLNKASSALNKVRSTSNKSSFKKPTITATVTDGKGNKRTYTGKDAVKIGAAVVARAAAKKASVAYHKAKMNTSNAAYNAVWNAKKLAKNTSNSINEATYNSKKSIRKVVNSKVNKKQIDELTKNSNRSANEMYRAREKYGPNSKEYKEAASKHLDDVNKLNQATNQPIINKK